uniref:Uncharacterized protein n=1 Tax=Arundo donax TaxID=35708 RepID=A0A0A9EZL4_ARUDO
MALSKGRKCRSAEAEAVTSKVRSVGQQGMQTNL